MCVHVLSHTVIQYTSYCHTCTESDRPSLCIRLERKCQKQKKTYYFLHDDVLSRSKQFCDEVPANGSETSCPVSRDPTLPLQGFVQSSARCLVASMTVVTFKARTVKDTRREQWCSVTFDNFLTKCYGHSTVQSRFAPHTHAKKASRRLW